MKLSNMWRPKRPNHNSGVNNHKAKLTDEKIREIRWMLSIGWTQRSLCYVYKISKTPMSNIARGKAWKHVT